MSVRVHRVAGDSACSGTSGLTSNSTYLSVCGAPQESDLLLLISRNLHRLHRAAAEAKHMLEFFHVSKAGGSTLCQLSVANGCTTQVMHVAVCASCLDLAG